MAQLIVSSIGKQIVLTAEGEEHTVEVLLSAESARGLAEILLRAAGPRELLDEDPYRATSKRHLQRLEESEGS
jgi:hypothetical protein